MTINQTTDNEINEIDEKSNSRDCEKGEVNEGRDDREEQDRGQSYKHQTLSIWAHQQTPQEQS